MPSLVHFQEILSASPGKVFNAWTVPELMILWLFKSATNRIEVPLLELHSGGRYSILETTAEGEKIDHYGSYSIIVPPERLSFTLEVPWHFPGVTTVNLTFRAIEGGCLMDFRQSGVDPGIVEDNWRAMFGQLKRVVCGS
jgi:uncharacterized protein YndB with AHSA1/START domain